MKPKSIRLFSLSKQRLSISFEDPTDEGEERPVLLFVPDVDEPEHYHIELGCGGAEDLAKAINDWIAEYKPWGYWR
jgi:hypothetical protein